MEWNGLTGKATERMVASIAQTRLRMQRQPKTPMKRQPIFGVVGSTAFIVSDDLSSNDVMVDVIPDVTLGIFSS
jgi:hypothetical protein